MSDFVIETKKLTKIYGEQTAVNSVNLHVKPGRIYGLLGAQLPGHTGGFVDVVHHDDAAQQVRYI